MTEQPKWVVDTNLLISRLLAPRGIKFVLIGHGTLSAGGTGPGTATTQIAPEALVREVMAACVVES